MDAMSSLFQWHMHTRHSVWKNEFYIYTKDNAYALGDNKTPRFMSTRTNFFGKICVSSNGFIKLDDCYIICHASYVEISMGPKTELVIRLIYLTMEHCEKQRQPLNRSLALHHGFDQCNLPDILPLQCFEIVILRKTWAYSILYWYKVNFLMSVLAPTPTTCERSRIHQL